MTDDTKEYIGDGVYAAFDGFALILTTENGIEVTNTVALEPREWAKLTKYVEALKSSLTATEVGLAGLADEAGRQSDKVDLGAGVNLLPPMKRMGQFEFSRPPKNGEVFRIATKDVEGFPEEYEYIVELHFDGRAQPFTVEENDEPITVKWVPLEGAAGGVNL